MKNYLKYLAASAAVISAVFISGCNSGGSSNVTPQTKANLINSKTTTFATKKTQNLGQGFYLLQPGAGYDDSTDTAVSDQSCLIAAESSGNVSIGSPSAYVNNGEQADLNTIENQLGIGIDGSVGLGGGVFSGSIIANYLQNSQDTDYKLNLTYLYEYYGTAILNNIGQGESALTPTAAAFAFGGDPVRFRKMCGNEFISQMSAGAFLGTTLTLKFKSSVDKEAFKAALSLSGGIGTISANIEQAAQKSNTSVELNISALQLGGDPQDLNQIFGTPQKNGNFPYVNCGSVESTSANTKACEKTVNAIIAYGQAMGQQLNNQDGSINPQKLYYYSAIATPYSAIGVTPNLPDPSPAVIAAANHIYQMYNDANLNYQFINNYLGILGNNLSTTSSVLLQDAQSYYKAQMQDIFQNQIYNIMDCYRGDISSQCPQIEANIESALATKEFTLPQEDVNLLNYFETSEYAGKLYTYTGTGTDTMADYSYSINDCVFYPISTQFSSQYIVSCGGYLYPITSGNGLVVTQSPSPTESGVILNVNGLQYNALNPNYPAYQPQITYPSMMMSQNPYAPTSFGEQGLTITGGSGLNTNTGDLTLSQLSKRATVGK